MTILKIHGCSGAGKTSAVRQFMVAGDFKPIYNGGKIEAYHDTSAGVIVLGSYENVCGGMDTVGSAEQALYLIDKYQDKGHLIHEGLLQSTYYGVMGEHSQRFGDKYVYAFLDTPVELCLIRLDKRRKAAGNTRNYNPDLTRKKHAVITHLQWKLENDMMGFKHKVATLKHDGDLVAQIKELLNEQHVDLSHHRV